MSTRVGVVGLGIMGSRMCANLVKAGFDVHAFDVDAAALARAGGATAAGDLRALGARSEVVVLSLPDAGPLRAVCAGEAGLFQHLPKGAVVCDTSTVDPASAREMAALAESAGVSFLDCPVSGGPPGAQAATLTIMAGGDAAALERARPVLEAIGRKIVHCGESGSGQAAKLVNQALVAAHTVAALDLMFKDLRLYVETATQLKSPALIGATALQIYNAARAAGHGNLDQTVVAKELERMSGATLGVLGRPG